MLPFQIQIAGATDAGARTYNEDALRFGTLPQGWFAVLSDGAGGHSNGAVASDIAVRIAVAELGRQAETGPVDGQALWQVVNAAHQAINDQQQGFSGHKRMHATLVVLWIDGHSGQASWAHVGDSRLYVLRRGAVQRVTRDDSVVQQMVDAGLIPPEQARHHPQRNQLAMALGTDDAVQANVASPGWKLADGDALLLCSDGWYDPLEAEQIESMLSDARDPEGWLQAMQQQVLQQRRPNQDNLSAIAVWAGDPGEVTRIAPL